MMSRERYESGFIKVESFLRAVATSFSQAQQALDRRSLDFAHEFLKFDKAGFSLKYNRMIRFPYSVNGDANLKALPLLSLVSFRRYRISELVVEFAVVRENHGSELSDSQIRFRFVPFGSQYEHSQSACIKITRKKERVLAEFQINGEIKETIVL